jgi:hypothetical protein
MPSLTSIQTSKTIKLLLIGNSGTGKTGALAALAEKNYKLRILDFDKGTDILGELLTNPNSPYVKRNPRCAENVESIMRLSDTMKTVKGKVYPLRASAWPGATDLLENWKDGEMTFGKVTTWDNDVVLVIDSLTMLSTAAYHYHLSLQGALGTERTQNEWRRDIGAAQTYIKALLAMLYDDAVKCNVIMISHITAIGEDGGMPVKDPQTGQMTSTVTGFPSAIGRSLSPVIPRYFNDMLLVKTIGTGAGIQRKIYTMGQTVDGQVINCKTSHPLSSKKDYPLETGLAEYFLAVRGNHPKGA